MVTIDPIRSSGMIGEKAFQEIALDRAGNNAAAITLVRWASNQPTFWKTLRLARVHLVARPFRAENGVAAVR